jgi:putative ABC transport system substrate-binding protein
MDRRTFIGNIAGGLLAVPLASRAENLGVPVIGFLGSVSPDAFEQRVAAIRDGLAQIGCTEEQNVAIERPEPVFLNQAIMPTKEES